MTVETDRRKFPVSLPSPPDFEEWDFRGVSPNDLATVLCYEIARQRPEDRDAIVSWQQSLAVSPAEKPDPNFEHFSATLPHRVQSIPELKQIALAFDQFPTPWMKLESTYRTTRIPPPPAAKCPAIVELSHKDRDPGDDERFPGGSAPLSPESLRCHALLIDWSLSDSILLQLFAEWLRVRRPPNHTGKTYVGKKASLPFDWLKQLAAFRFSEAKVAYSKAKQIVHERKMNVPRDGVYDVLPKYGSDGAWSNAIRKARELVEGVNPYWQVTFRCHHLPKLLDALEPSPKRL